MMLKKYIYTCADGLNTPPHGDSKKIVVPEVEATIPSVIDTFPDEVPVPVLDNTIAYENSSTNSIIVKFLSDNGIVVLEKHHPEVESELSEISYLLDGIANHIDEAEDLLHTLRKSIAETDGKFTYNPNKLNHEQLESVKKIVKLLKLCGVFSELRTQGSYSGTVSTATRVRSFISGTWLELFSQQHGIEVISEKAKQLNLPYEVLCNVKVADQEGTQHEIDLMFSIGNHVFAVEMKSGLNFMDYDRYRLLAEYLHLIPDRFMLVNSTLLDKEATKCIIYFYRYYICNSADYMTTLSAMIDKAFNS